MLDQKFEGVAFVYYSTYHMLFDWYLKQYKKMRILCRDSKKRPVDLLDIHEDNGIRKYKAYEASRLELQEYMDQQEVNKALYRSGLLMPEKWQDIGNNLSRYNEIILGLETHELVGRMDAWASPQALKTCPKGTTIHHSSIIIHHLSVMRKFPLPWHRDTRGVSL